MDEQFFDDLKAKSKELKKFCKENGITKIGSEYYFDINGQSYIVTSHIVRLNDKAKNVKGDRYIIYGAGRKPKYIRIRATQDKLPRIYNDLKNGVLLDCNGEKII